MFRTIKFKMIALIAICLGLGALAVSWRFQRMYEDNVALISRESIQGAAAAFGDLERTNTDLMAASLTMLLHDPSVGAAVAARDPERLLAISLPLFKECKPRYGITNWNWWELEAAGETAPKQLRNIARVQAPPRRGDMVERVALQRVAKERKLVTGLDLGWTGLALRALVPVEHEGQVAGYVELGMEIKFFLERMKQLSGNEYGLIVKKALMDQKMWTSTKANLGDRDNWADMPDLLLVQDTAKDGDMFRYSGRIEDVPDAGQALEIVSKGDRSFARGAFPIRDMAGNKLGAVFVLRDITSLYAEMRAAQRQAVLTMVVLMAVLAGVLVTVFQVLVVRRLQRMIVVATRVVGGEYDTQIVPSAQDELGTFETLFEQFRALFVELLGREQKAADPDARAGERR